MGLDMYLYTNSKALARDINADEGEEWNAPRGIAIYWRKANAVHNWFVENIQGGVDDCGDYDVSIEDLARLHDTIKEVLDSTELIENGTAEVYDLKASKMVSEPLMVLKDTEKAKELLPTASGFFFGGTNYDMWYWWDLQYTQRKLAFILDNCKPSDGWHAHYKDESDWYLRFTYHSSW